MSTALEIARAKAAGKQVDIKSQVKAVATKVEEAIEKKYADGVTFYAKIPHSRFVYEDGTEEIFYFGRAIVTNEAHINELLKILPPLGNNPNIFLPDAIPKQPEKPTQNAVQERELNQVEGAIIANNKTSVKQEIGNLSLTPLSDSNKSTLDPDLVKAMAGKGNIGTGEITEISADNLNPGAANSNS